MTENPVLLYVTVKDRADAIRIGRALVEKRLAACTNVWDGMQSCYWWEGKIEQASEAVLLVKTVRERVPAATQLIKALHAYQVPCILELPIQGGNPDYLAWLGEQTRG